MNTGPGQGGGHALPHWWPAADPRHVSPSTSDVMSQLCRVCGEPAAGFHFGAFTCEGCKSFFGRTYNNLSSISECKNNGECVINKKNRTSCKACRLRKCLVVGMSKSGSRYGRRSNWFKIHCLLQEQQLHHQQQHQQHQPHQHPQHPSAGAQLFQQHRRQSVAAGGTSLEPVRTTTPPPPPPPPPLSWTDVKHHHMRLDADNNNSVAGDLNKDDGGRLSASGAAASAAAAAAATAAVARVVRPELMRWPSPFFPAFPFPPAAPFFMALHQPAPSPPQPPRRLRSRSPGSPASRSSSSGADRESDDRDDDDDDDDALDGRGRGGPTRSARVPRLPPVQESPMDLSVSAVRRTPPSPTSTPSRSPSRSPSPSVGGRRSPGSGSDRSGTDRTDSDGPTVCRKYSPLNLTRDRP